MPLKTLFIFGTRPEAVKLAPVVTHLLEQPEHFTPVVCITAQHRQLLDQVMRAFGLVPDHDLNTMGLGQTLFQSTSRILAALEPILEKERPDVVFVQGDTTTTFCGALAGFYAGVPVAHVEAGLRTHDLQQPFPEEANRVLTGRLATLHFAATTQAEENLRREGVPADQIWLTGNTGIDAVQSVARDLEAREIEGWPWRGSGRRLILVTAHRRENFGYGIENICTAVERLAVRADVEIVWPVHPNPRVRETVEQRLANVPNVHLIAPLDYVEFIDAMRRAELLLTDSGGVQEEGPSLGKPVLVLRDVTERPEGVEAGCAELVGTDPSRIALAATRLLDEPERYARMAQVQDVYGDGRASQRIAEALLAWADGH